MKHSIPYLKFRRKKLGMLCFWILVVMYLSFIFEGFLAPYQPNTKFKSKSYQPPHAIHLIHDGKFIGPFVYEYEMANPFYKKYKTDRAVIHKLSLFVKGDSYKLFGLIPSKTHLFGTEDGEPVFLLGADRLGRDMLSRII